MILDLHAHSDASEDSRAPLETYLKWLQRKRDVLPIDGIVLTEHRQWDPTVDYRPLEDRYGILILRGAEVAREQDAEPCRHAERRQPRRPTRRCDREIVVFRGTGKVADVVRRNAVGACADRRHRGRRLPEHQVAAAIQGSDEPADGAEERRIPHGVDADQGDGGAVAHV